MNGALTLRPLSLDGHVALSALQLPRFAPYYADKILFDVENGELDFSCDYKAQFADGSLSFSVSGVHSTLTDLSLRRRDAERLVSIPRIDVSEGAMDLGKREAHIHKVAVTGPSAEVIREKNGDLNLLRLLPAISSALATTTTVSGAPATPWNATLGQLLIQGGMVRFTDRMPRVEATLAQFGLTAVRDVFQLALRIRLQECFAQLGVDCQQDN